uniref:Uncharacterized protein n=1 Tax=Oryza rufipogon TaxID=4529 RepID=A0A0E0QZT4_ORYRU
MGEALVHRATRQRRQRRGSRRASASPHAAATIAAANGVGAKSMAMDRRPPVPHGLPRPRALPRRQWRGGGGGARRKQTWSSTATTRKHRAVAEAGQLCALLATIAMLLTMAIIAFFTDLNILSNLPRRPLATPISSPAAAAAAAAQLLSRQLLPAPCSAPAICAPHLLRWPSAPPNCSPTARACCTVPSYSPSPSPMERG